MLGASQWIPLVFAVVPREVGVVAQIHGRQLLRSFVGIEEEGGAGIQLSLLLLKSRDLDDKLSAGLLSALGRSFILLSLCNQLIQ